MNKNEEEELEPSSEEAEEELTKEDEEYRSTYLELLARSETVLAAIGNGSDGSSTGAKARSDRRKEADKVNVPELPTVPGYGVWLEVVMTFG